LRSWFLSRRVGIGPRCQPSPGKRATPTDRLSGFGTGLATSSNSFERVPRGHCQQYSVLKGSATASFFRSLATHDGGVACDLGLAQGRQSLVRTTWLGYAAAGTHKRYCAGAPVRWGSPGCRSRFLSRRSVPARIRSWAVRTIDARSSALLSTLRGRPGGRRIRLNASRSFGKMAQTEPTLVPYSRCLTSNRRT